MSRTTQKKSRPTRIAPALVPVSLSVILAGCATIPAPEPLAAAVAPTVASSSIPVDDSFLWLEDVQGEKAMAWVRGQNQLSTGVLKARPEFVTARAKVLDILNSKDKIAYINRIGDHVYNLWTDADHQRGLWRRTSLSQYRQEGTQWEVVLDIDALGKAEGESWVWGGADCLAPGYQRCLITLSRGGSDAGVVREFDLKTKSFVAGGFSLPEAKSDVSWVDDNTLHVGTDFGEGSMTKSGYPRVIKQWKRGTPLAQAKAVFEVQNADVYAYAYTTRDRGFERTVFGRGIDFYNSENTVLVNGKMVKIDKPLDANFSPVREWATISLRSDWVVSGKTYKSGSLLLTNFDAYMAGKREFTVLFEPTPTASLSGHTFTKKHVIVDVLDNVKSRLIEWTQVAGVWRSRAIAAPVNGTIGVSSFYDSSLADDPLGDQYLITYKDFLTPDSLMLGRAGSDARDVLKQLPKRFDATGMSVQQQFATSADGTRIPYFIVSPKGVRTDGTNPTLLYGYGGFQVSEQPWYSGSWGNNWLAAGGVFVVANIRGGGEFGPNWHQAAIKDKKQRSYDDFIAVAQDLIERKVTSPKQLGIMGGSNGGLLVGAVAMQRPELFNAVVCQVPLLDMKRYHLLLAGDSWKAEYGDPDDPAQWATLAKFSPYQNVKTGVKYPRVFFNTSTKDDRVHPGHARKMVAKMQSQGHDVLYFENIEGGHGGAADNSQRADLLGLEFAYLWMQLGRNQETAN